MCQHVLFFFSPPFLEKRIQSKLDPAGPQEILVRLVARDRWYAHFSKKTINMNLHVDVAFSKMQNEQNLFTPFVKLQAVY